MPLPDKIEELSVYFMRLQSSNDITTYQFFQNLVVYLSAKQIIENRKKRLLKDKSLEDMLSSTLNTLYYEETVNEFLDAARILMPGLYNQFSFSTIKETVFELSTSDDGLEKCYSFLKLKEFSNARKTLFTFKSNKQTNYTYDADRNEKSESYMIYQIISLFQDGNSYEFEMLNTSTNSKKRIEELKFEGEAHGYICYSNSDVRVQLNRDDPFFDPAINSANIIDQNKRWMVSFEI